MSSFWKNWQTLACAATFLLITTAATIGSADIVMTENVNAGIPDNNQAGLVSTMNITGDETINGISVSLNGIEHTWVGDLTVTLSGPAGQSLTLFERTGEGALHDSSNLREEFPDGGIQSYRFVDTGGLWWDEASVGETNYDMVAGNYSASDSDGTPINMNAAVAGTSTMGNWTLSITDGAGGDTGSLVSWTLSFSSTAASVPEPNSLIVLACLSLFTLRRRRS